VLNVNKYHCLYVAMDGVGGKFYVAFVVSGPIAMNEGLPEAG
jgi:hypothetical protein